MNWKKAVIIFLEYASIWIIFSILYYNLIGTFATGTLQYEIWVPVTEFACLALCIFLFIKKEKYFREFPHKVIFALASSCVFILVPLMQCIEYPYIVIEKSGLQIIGLVPMCAFFITNLIIAWREQAKSTAMWQRFFMYNILLTSILFLPFSFY